MGAAATCTTTQWRWRGMTTGSDGHVAFGTRHEGCFWYALYELPYARGRAGAPHLGRDARLAASTTSAYVTKLNDARGRTDPALAGKSRRGSRPHDDRAAVFNRAAQAWNPTPFYWHSMKPQRRR